MLTVKITEPTPLKFPIGRWSGSHWGSDEHRRPRRPPRDRPPAARVGPGARRRRRRARPGLSRHPGAGRAGARPSGRRAAAVALGGHRAAAAALPGRAEDGPDDRLRARPAAGAGGGDPSTAGATGLHLLVGGGLLQRVDFDTGDARPLAGLPTCARTSGSTRSTWPAALYATTDRCRARSSPAACSPCGATAPRRCPRPRRPGWWPTRPRAWVLRDPPHVLAPLAGGKDVDLPGGFAPVAATRGLVVGNLCGRWTRTRSSPSTRAPASCTPPPVRSARSSPPARGGCTGPRAAPRTPVPAARRGRAGRGRAPVPAARAAGRLARQVSPDGRYLALVVDHVADGRPRSPALGGDVALLDLRRRAGADRPGPGAVDALPAELRVRAGRLAGRRLRARRAGPAGGLARRAGPSGAVAASAPPARPHRRSPPPADQPDSV